MGSKKWEKGSWACGRVCVYNCVCINIFHSMRPIFCMYDLWDVDRSFLSNSC